MTRYFIVILLFLINNHHLVAQKDSLSVLVLGDSYSASTGELKINGWPMQLAEALSEKGIEVKDPFIVAGAGWTTSKLIEQIDKKSLVTNFDLVGLLIGVNNQYRDIDINVFKKEFVELLEKSIAHANGNPANVFVISIPDWSVTPFAKFKNQGKISLELKKYNDFIEAQTIKRKVLYFDITGISRKAQFNKNLIASDSLHPSKKMYRLWVNKMKKPLIKKLKY